MNMISWPSIAFYGVFSIFVYYQQLHGRNFNGGSAAFGFLLSLFGFAGMITGFAYLGYYGWTVSWLGAVVAFVVGILAIIPGIAVERIVGKLALSVAGFVVWPLFSTCRTERALERPVMQTMRAGLL